MTSVLGHLALFAASLAVTFVAAGFFARRLDRIGLRLGLPETLLGLLTALAADAPEVSSAITALAKGSQSAGIGVVVGSNVFNLAAMIGLSAVLRGPVRLRRESLAIEGAVGLAVTAVVAAVVADWLAPAAGLAIIAVVLVPYVALLVAGPAGVAKLPLRPRPKVFLRRMFGEGHAAERRLPAHRDALLLPMLTLVLAVAVIVAGSIGMVTAALTLADRWRVPHFVIGVVVLAVLTSLPNAFTAVRLGLQGRGSALLSETLNSNTINLVAGVAIPSLVLGLGTFTGLVAFDFGWLIATTVLALVLLGTARGLGRGAGAALIFLYVAFLSEQLAHL